MRVGYFDRFLPQSSPQIHKGKGYMVPNIHVLIGAKVRGLSKV